MCIHLMFGTEANEDHDCKSGIEHIWKQFNQHSRDVFQTENGNCLHPQQTLKLKPTKGKDLSKISGKLPLAGVIELMATQLINKNPTPFWSLAHERKVFLRRYWKGVDSLNGPQLRDFKQQVSFKCIPEEFNKCF